MKQTNKIYNNLLKGRYEKKYAETLKKYGKSKWTLLFKINIKT